MNQSKDAVGNKTVRKNHSAKDVNKLKSERFRIVASRRVQKVLDSLGNLEKCANRRNYEYTDDDVKKMVKVIGDKFSLLKISFSAETKKRKQKFEF